MASGGFRRKSEGELAKLSEDELIAYLLTARRAADKEASGLALAMLSWGFMDNVRYRVALKVPREAVDEVAESVLLSALTSEFDGASVGEFRKWIGAIIQRRVADYHRDPRRDVRLGPLPSEHLDDDEVWGDEPSIEFEGEAIDIERAIETALGESNPTHRRVIELTIFDDAAPKDVAGQLDVTVDNVHQIVRRFRVRLDELLSSDDDTSG